MPGMVLAIPSACSAAGLSDRVLVVLGLLAITAGGGVAAASNSLATRAAGACSAAQGSSMLPLLHQDDGRLVCRPRARHRDGRGRDELAVRRRHGPGRAWLARRHEGWRMPFAVASIYSLLTRSPCWPSTASRRTARPRRRRLGPADRPRMEPDPDRRLGLGGLQRGLCSYLSFAPQVLTDGGMGALTAARSSAWRAGSMICLRHLVRPDRRPVRPRRPDPPVCLLAGMASLRPAAGARAGRAAQPRLRPDRLAPAGLIMALTGAAMAPTSAPLAWACS